MHADRRCARAPRGGARRHRRRARACGCRYRPPFDADAAAGLPRRARGPRRRGVDGTTLPPRARLPHGAGRRSTLAPRRRAHVARPARGWPTCATSAPPSPGCRRLLDLDADPAAVDDVLGADPALAAAGRRGAGLPAAGQRRRRRARASARCSASRCRSPAPARSPPGSPPTPARRCRGAGRHAHPRFPDGRDLAERRPERSAHRCPAAHRAVLALAAALADGALPSTPARDRDEAARRSSLAARDRPVDGRAPGDAGARRPRRAAARRPRRAPRLRALGQPSDAAG